MQLSDWAPRLYRLDTWLLATSGELPQALVTTTQKTNGVKMDNGNQFANIWKHLLLAGPQGSFYLNQMSIDGIRGMRDFSITFKYPVTVLAGENGCGKSTVLFAAAFAYDNPRSTGRATVSPPTTANAPTAEANLLSPTPTTHPESQPERTPRRTFRQQYAPSVLFPQYDSANPEFKDQQLDQTLRFELAAPGRTLPIEWLHRNNTWQRTHQPDLRPEDQPYKPTYLRTLAGVASPSSLRNGFQQVVDHDGPHSAPLTVEQIQFASLIVPHLQYHNVVELSDSQQDLLFAFRDNKPNYSELQMAAGERVALRIGLEVSQLQNALVLIDEVEAGLHPRAQELLMMRLQWLALHRQLQIIVTTHSLIVLDCVPSIGRRFLERTADGNVRTTAPYPDIVQDVHCPRCTVWASASAQLQNSV